MKIKLSSTQISSDLVDAFRQHIWLLLFGGGYIVTCTTIINRAGFSILDSNALASCAFLIMAIVTAFITGQAVWVITAIRPKHPVPILLGRLRSNLSWSRCVTALPVLLLLGPFAMAFTQMKSIIPILHPYDWDTTFAQLDAWLHFGTQPWQWLAPLLLNGPIVSIITVIYTGIWFLACFGTLTYAALDINRPQARMQFILSYFACWSIMGTFAAIIFSSVGPVYFQHFGTPSNLYQPLTEQLRLLDAQGWFTPVFAIDLVWNASQSKNIAMSGLGISAMPSLHVAMGCLIYLYARTFGPIARLISGAFFGMIFVGSVLLGWHYAIDSYAAIFGTVIIWKAAGWVSKMTLKARAPAISGI